MAASKKKTPTKRKTPKVAPKRAASSSFRLISSSEENDIVTWLVAIFTVLCLIFLFMAYQTYYM